MQAAQISYTGEASVLLPFSIRVNQGGNSGSKLFSLRVDPIWKVFHNGKQTGSSRLCCSFVKLAEKHGCRTKHLKQ